MLAAAIQLAIIFDKKTTTIRRRAGSGALGMDIVFCGKKPTP
jgi:3-deoxy-D-manno-octulosonate 8-phosphate phosphatase KdsC-like HAD superfamily phosphatase